MPLGCQGAARPLVDVCCWEGSCLLVSTVVTNSWLMQWSGSSIYSTHQLQQSRNLLEPQNALRFFEVISISSPLTSYRDRGGTTDEKDFLKTVKKKSDCKYKIALSAGMSLTWQQSVAQQPNPKTSAINLHHVPHTLFWTQGHTWCRFFPDTPNKTPDFRK